MRLRPPALLACALVAIIAAGCQTTPSPSPSSPGATSTPVAGESPVAGATGAPEAAPTSETLIAAALAADAITYEQSLLYRALALFDSPGLPAEFRSATADLGAGTELAIEIDAHEGELPADLLAKLAPYRVRPSDPISIFNAGLNRPVAGALLAVGPTEWASQIAVPGEARVWVPGDAQGELQRHAADVAKVWAAYEDVFTKPDPDQPADPNPTVNPDKLVDFYFVDVSALDPRAAACVDPSITGCSLYATGAAGMARPAEPRRVNASSAYFVIDAARSGDEALFQLAHEVAHGGEFHYDNGEASWFFEATANWVAYRVFQKLGLVPNSAYQWLRGTSRATGFFDRMDQPLDTERGFDAYGAWLYFQFAAMQRGDAVVASMWQAAGGVGAQGVTAIDSVLPFKDNFAEFALRNWNKEPVPTRYRSAPDSTFPNIQPKLAADETVHPADTHEVLVQLPTLAATYHSYVIDPKTRRIEFENPLAGRPGFHLWAIKNIRETWQEPEDWTDVGSRKFCRDVAVEDVGQIILIASNDSLTQRFDPGETPTIKGSASGCGDWRGTMSATHSWNTTFGSGSATSTFDGVWTEAEDKLIQPCQADYLGKDACVVYIPDGTVTWTWHSKKTGPNPEEACEQTTGGAVPIGEPVPPGTIFHQDSQMLVLEPVAPEGFAYWGLGTFKTPDATCWASVESNSKHPPQFFDIYKGSSASNSAGDGNTCWASTWEIDPAGTTIKGSCFQYDYDYNSLYFEWNLTRIGPPPGG